MLTERLCFVISSGMILTLPETAEPLDFPVEHLNIAVCAGRMRAWRLSIATGAVSFDRTQIAFAESEGRSASTAAEKVFALIHPEDLPSVRNIVRGSIDEKCPFSHEFRISENGDGTWTWLAVRGDVVCDPEGRVTHLTGLSWDVTQAKRREEQTVLTSREMAHRVKNVIALVQGIARMSARNHDKVDTFLPGFLERTSAIAAVNDLVLASETRRPSLANVVADTLHSANVDGRIRIDVDDFEVNAAAAQTLVLVLNELATNAVKYGALEKPDGSIQLEILIDRESDRFTLNWIEERAEPIRETAGYKGFGSQVLMSLTKATYTGEPKYEWMPNGMRYSCTWTASEMSVDNQG